MTRDWEADDTRLTLEALRERPSVIDELRGKTILLTGSGGFLGRKLVRVIDLLNAEVGTCIRLIALDAIMENMVTRESLKLPKFIDFVNHDLSMGIGVATKLDYVIHAAGIASPYWYQKDPLKTFDVALKGTRMCLELAQKNNARFLFTSTSEVYQTPDEANVPTSESYVGAIPLRAPRSCYDMSKAAAETLTHIFQGDGVDTVTVRIFNSFGPALRETDYRIMAKLGSAMRSGQPLRIFIRGEMAPTRTYCYAVNTVLGILLALVRGASGGVYNIGADTPEISVWGLVARAQRLGFPVTAEVVEPPAVYVAEPQRRCPDITHARNDLGYELAVDLDDGLTRFLHWCTAHYTGCET